MTELVADFILKRLREWGIEHVYAYPGDGIDGLVAGSAGPTTNRSHSDPP